ncbi:MAG: sugar phosphate isomerase/epimerase family protein [Alphaproteobacteria bacterium]|jgi:sugar phosphate isomerase/epimerase|nr:sugar phosphate isomerase/epimerase family protein [Alphaproteobacteria bacterium]
MTTNTQGYAINTYAYSLSHSADACLGHLAARGHRQFEVMMYPGHLWPADMDQAARRGFKTFLADNGLEIVTLNMPNVDINVAGAATEMRAYSLELLKGVVGLAGDLGVPGVVVGPGKANPLMPAPRERLIGYFFEALDVLVPLADAAGTALWVENMPFAFLPEADEMMQVLERYGDERLGVVYDLANGAFIREDLGEGLRRVKDRLKLVHLSDTPLDIYRHAPVGQGIVAFAEVVPVLQEIGYAGPPMLEIISDAPDDDLPASMAALDTMGWDRIARR